MGTCLAPNGSPSGSQNRPRRSLEHTLGALGELLDSLGSPFSVRIHSSSVFIFLPKPICACISATFIFSGQETMRKHVKDRCGKKDGELKKLPSNMRLNIYPDDRLWINIQT